VTDAATTEVSTAQAATAIRKALSGPSLGLSSLRPSG